MKVDKLKAIVCVISIVILAFVVVYNSDELKKHFDKDEKKVEEKTDAIKFKEEYESLNGTKTDSGRTYPKVEINKNNPIKYSDADEVVNVIEKGTGIIYLGYPKCPWCRNAVPVLLQAATDLEIETIYYINMYDERDSYVVEDGKLVQDKKGTEGYKKLLKALDKKLDEYIVKDEDGKEYKTGEKRIYVPYIIFVREGEIVGIHADTVESQKDPYVLLNDEQKEELYGIFTKYIHEVLNDICDERC